MDITNPIFLTLLITMAIQAFFFIFAATIKTDKVTDLSYGLTFIIVAAYWLLTNSETAAVFEVTLTAMIIIWGIRISSYLLIRIIKTGRDRRFDEVRDKFLQFAKFWLLQGISVWIIMIPSVYLLTRSETTSMGAIAYLGIAIWLVGFVIETIADAQLYRFRFSKNSTGKWIDEGLWHYSRHPNYFGEMLVWWGLFVYGLDAYQGIAWLSVVGPIFITALLLFGSGIPILEKGNNRRWGKDKDYQKYKKTTSLVILLPKR